VRFDSSRRRSSRILFLTEGLLLRQIASDPNLSAYSVVIVDEVGGGWIKVKMNGVGSLDRTRSQVFCCHNR